MSLSIKYVPVKVGKLETAIAFFKDQLGMDQTETASVFEDRKQLIVKSQNGETSFLLLETSGFHRDSDEPKGKIVLKTEDCIGDYHILRSKGVQFQSRPDYLPMGLSAVFSDPFGNEYILLEERCYVED